MLRVTWSRKEVEEFTFGLEDYGPVSVFSRRRKMSNKVEGIKMKAELRGVLVFLNGI